MNADDWFGRYGWDRDLVESWVLGIGWFAALAFCVAQVWK